MRVIIITGSTRGIGYGLADSFLKQGCAVIISGRSDESVNNAVTQLGKVHKADRILGSVCDVTDIKQLDALWNTARNHFGKVDIWINNAGISNKQIDFWKLDKTCIRDLINTNLIGPMYGSQVAINNMLEQGFGSIYNMEGLGSDGRVVPGMTLYGSSKSAIRYFTKSLSKESAATPVIIGTLSPGMVLTDLLLKDRSENRDSEWNQFERIVNILGDKVETVTPWLVRQILKNNKNGAAIAWLTTGKVLWRFLTAPFRKRDLFSLSE